LARYLPPENVFFIILALALSFLLNSPTKAGVGKSLYFASLHYGVPFLLLVAIADVESSFNPLVINVNNSRIKCPRNANCVYYQNGTVIRPDSARSAKKILKNLHEKGYNYDVGLMQINRLWIEKYRLPPEVFLDEEYNALFGAFILKKLLERYSYKEAIWRYNGSRSYLQKVLRKIKSYTRGR